mgnify:CR=1 FL=1|jgi:hypothetical protein
MKREEVLTWEILFPFAALLPYSRYSTVLQVLSQRFVLSLASMMGSFSVLGVLVDSQHSARLWLFFWLRMGGFGLSRFVSCNSQHTFLP